LNDCIINDEDISDECKSKISMKLANTEKLLSDGADENLQLLHLLTTINITINLK